MLIAIFSTGSAGAKANTRSGQCFLLAERYYEQLYCEIKQQGGGDKLPRFLEFRKNPEMTQALLLKRPASALGIPLKMPKKSSNSKLPSISNSQANKASTPRPSAQASEQPFSHLYTANCILDNRSIHCGQTRYDIIGNQRNQRLQAGVLEADNTLNFPAYPGKPNDAVALKGYLTERYRQYLEKMLEIGLGGVTMSFTKFYYLYQDLQSKGADFSARFETMFRFLKKDKLTMHISEAIEPIAQLSITDCEQLSERMFSCDNRHRNTLYLRR